MEAKIRYETYYECTKFCRDFVGRVPIISIFKKYKNEVNVSLNFCSSLFSRDFVFHCLRFYFIGRQEILY